MFSPVLWQGQKDLSRLSPRSGLDAAHRAAGPHDTHCAGAQPCLVAESLCALTKKERQADACLSFLAGAEGLEPSARGFGVDVGRKQRKKKWRSRGVCQGEEGSCGAELVLKAGAGKNIARTLREEKSDIGKPIVRVWGKHRGPNRRRFCRQREKSLRVALCAVFGAG